MTVYAHLYCIWSTEHCQENVFAEGRELVELWFDLCVLNVNLIECGQGFGTLGIKEAPSGWRSVSLSLAHSLSHSLTLDLHVDTHPDLRAAFSRPWYTTQTRRNWEALCLSHTHTLSKDSVTQSDWEWNDRLKNQLSRNLICLCVIQTDEDLLMWNCQINDQWGLFEELIFETRLLWCHWFEIHGVRDFLQITGTLSWHLSKTVFFEYFSSSTTVLVDVNETWLGNVNTHYSSKIWAQ